MMSLETKLQPLITALVSAVGDNVFHYWRANMPVPCCVWQEDVESSNLTTDNHKQAQGISGSIDYFTATEFDSTVDGIQAALTALENCAWSLDMVQYENETKLIHHSWSFTII